VELKVHRSINRLVEVLPTVNAKVVGRDVFQRFCTAAQYLSKDSHPGDRWMVTMQEFAGWHPSPHIRSLAEDTIAAFQLIKDARDANSPS